MIAWRESSLSQLFNHKMLASEEIMVRKVVECQCTIRINFKCSFHFLHSSANPTSYGQVAKLELETRGEHNTPIVTSCAEHVPSFVCKSMIASATKASTFWGSSCKVKFNWWRQCIHLRSKISAQWKRYGLPVKHAEKLAELFLLVQVCIGKRLYQALQQQDNWNRPSKLSKCIKVNKECQCVINMQHSQRSMK